MDIAQWRYMKSLTRAILFCPADAEIPICRVIDKCDICSLERRKITNHMICQKFVSKG